MATWNMKITRQRKRFYKLQPDPRQEIEFEVHVANAAVN